jgi:lauroyl/myristoyl acyltransferase
MAMAARAPVIPAAVTMGPDGQYRLAVGEPIVMLTDGDAVSCIRRNAEAVLEVMAEFIGRAPQQWLMYYRVWPHTLAACPS